MAEEDAILINFCALEVLLNDYILRLKEQVLYIELRAYFGNKTTCEVTCFSKDTSNTGAFSV